jgi:hypothetical protein
MTGKEEDTTAVQVWHSKLKIIYYVTGETLTMKLVDNIQRRAAKIPIMISGFLTGPILPVIGIKTPNAITV